MTYDEFFEMLPKDGWRLMDSFIYPKRSLIRRFTSGYWCQCPVTAAFEIRGVSPFGHKNLNLYNSQVISIVRAADQDFIHDSELRRRLLEHCGLT